MSSESLSAGTYTIRCALDPQLYVSRNLTEDKSLRPKTIASQAQGVKPGPDLHVSSSLCATNISERGALS